MSLALGVAAGVVAALKRNSITDMFATTGAMFGIAMPDFWFALMLILLFGVTLGILPVFGSELVWQSPVEGSQAHGAARAGAWAERRGDHHAPDALVAARSDGRGLHTHCARQRAVRAPRHMAARAPKLGCCRWLRFSAYGSATYSAAP